MTELELTESEEVRIRIALSLIGEEAGRDGDSPQPAPRTVWWRGRRSAIVGALVTAAALCAGLLVSGVGVEGSGRPSGRAQEGGQGQTYAEWIACSRMIVEGDVVAVRDARESGRVVVTFAVQDWIKPAQGAGQIELDVADPATVDPLHAYEPGSYALLVVPMRRELPVVPFLGDELKFFRDVIDRTLPEAAGTECPPYWRGDTDDSTAGSRGDV